MCFIFISIFLITLLSTNIYNKSRVGFSMFYEYIIENPFHILDSLGYSLAEKKLSSF